MNRRYIQKHWYLIVASAAILIATLALLVMQYRSVQRTQAQTRATMEANLELHLLEMVDEAKRDTLDHASHIMHAIRQQRIRERNIPSIERAFTRTIRRYPEVQDFYVIFFEPGKQDETWRALKFIRPDKNKPVSTYDGIPLGSLVEDPPASEALRRAWNSVPKHSQTTLYAAFDPNTAEMERPQQFFFHTVYELDRLKRTAELECIGLLVFSAHPESFPSKDYLKKLVADHEKGDKEINGLLGKLNYSVSLTHGDTKRDLVTTENTSGMLRTRKFDASSSLFPNLSFTIHSKDFEAKSFDNGYVQSSVLLAIGAAVLSFIGLGLTWRATQREMKVAQLKSDFLTNISHELKTPLTAIRAFGDLLHSGRAKDAERIREYGEIIKTESDRLTALINNILEMSRLERGVRRYRLEEGYLCEAVAETVEIFRHSPESAGFKIQVELPTPPVKTKFDESAIRQALLNLLSNAVKYSGDSDGSKRIEVRVKNDKNQAVIEVRDFGIGIAPGEQSQIFKPFHRVEQDAKAKGSGLGLAIVREIARAHGGEVAVESGIEKGSTFSLHLPVLEEIPVESAARVLPEGIKDGTYLGYRG